MLQMTPIKFVALEHLSRLRLIHHCPLLGRTEAPLQADVPSIRRRAAHRAAATPSKVWQKSLE